ncbi:hypothetical protein [Magnetospirillum aberrantis]|uniref:Uncharacterized protein n=1 Tax=Magnetospirillum aberrantis SpK TaxID=908842 RepID=A0A7C9UUU7_9PROT|nr:hypothetical protein [Magnetospirillum aberrantis]NFV80988.1 hypothetical protein [Magnetospirillum aberrantis SpK]
MNTITDNPTAAARRFLQVWTTMLNLTDRPDRPRVEQLVKDAYRAAGLPHPRHIIWCASPLTMAWARSLFPLVADNPVGPNVADQLVHAPMQRARSAVHVETGELAMLCGELENGVLAATKPREQALWDALARDDLPFPDQPSWIKGAVAGTVTLHTQCSAAEVMAAAPRYQGIGDAVLGATTPGTISLSFLRRRIGLVAETQAVAPLLDLLMETHMLIAHANVCYISEAPVLIDEQGMYYVDGWELAC